MYPGSPLWNLWMKWTIPSWTWHLKGLAERKKNVFYLQRHSCTKETQRFHLGIAQWCVLIRLDQVLEPEFLQFTLGCKWLACFNGTGSCLDCCYWFSAGKKSHFHFRSFGSKLLMCLVILTVSANCISRFL